MEVRGKQQTLPAVLGSHQPGVKGKPLFGSPAAGSMYFFKLHTHIEPASWHHHSPTELHELH